MMYQRILVGATARPRLAKPSAEMSPRIVSAKIPSCLCWYPETVWALCLSSCVCSALFGSFRVNLRMMQNLGRISVPARGTAGPSWAASPNARWAPAKVRAAPPSLDPWRDFLFLHALERNFITAASAALHCEAVHWTDGLGSCLSLCITAQVQSPWRSEGIQDLTENHKN